MDRMNGGSRADRSIFVIFRSHLMVNNFLVPKFREVHTLQRTAYDNWRIKDSHDFLSIRRVCSLDELRIARG